MFHIAFYVPEEHAEVVKEKMFDAGAGSLGNYERCSFESKGIGQFKPNAEANPFIGRREELERVSELKVEMICKRECLEHAIGALKSSHPYETPAYYVTEMVRI